MGKNKLQKFNDMAHFPHVFEFPYAILKEKNVDLSGKWNQTVFKNNHPIIIELGCGRGEYTVGLGKLFPHKNFIGIDIKGARMWAGAKESWQTNMKNIAFLRTHIELIDQFFSPGEIAEIWLTFPDPQMKKLNKRLTGTRFIHLYRKILPEDGVIHLKTDSNFLYTYTIEMAKINRLPIFMQTDNLYQSGPVNDILSIRTHYEQQWIERGLNIKYIQFTCKGPETLKEPEIEIELDPYRSYNRSKRSEKSNAY